LLLRELEQLKEEIYANPDLELDDRIKKLRQVNYKNDYRQRCHLDRVRALGSCSLAQRVRRVACAIRPLCCVGPVCLPPSLGACNFYKVGKEASYGHKNSPILGQITKFQAYSMVLQGCGKGCPVWMEVTWRASTFLFHACPFLSLKLHNDKNRVVVRKELTVQV